MDGDQYGEATSSPVRRADRNAKLTMAGMYNSSSPYDLCTNNPSRLTDILLDPSHQHNVLGAVPLATR